MNSRYADAKEVTVSIEGRLIKAFHTLTVQQSIHDYHQFELAFEHDQIQPRQTLNSDAKEQFVGRNIEVTITARVPPDAKPFEFSGLITSAELHQGDGGYWGRVLLRGVGAVAKVAGVPGISMYRDMTVQAIVNKCLGGVMQLSAKAPTGPDHQLPFCVRYKETYWNFVKRLAYDYGAWFYYDGKQLHFTATPTSPTLALFFGSNVQRLRVSSRTVPVAFAQYDYLPETDRMITKENPPGRPNPYQTMTENGTLVDRPITLAADLTAFTSNRKAALTASTLEIEAEAELPGIYPGLLCSISGQNVAPLGRYVVTEVTHTVDALGRYTNRFRAVPADTKAMPPGPLTHPVAGPQPGKITANKDPLGLGRVQVQLQWMQSNEATPWIRVMQPTAGLYASGSKTRGSLFVPEINDAVLVDFQEGNPERPYVAGALPHGKNYAVPDSAKPTKEKHLSVASGSTLTFIDDAPAHELHLKVNDGNLITLVVNGAEGTLTIKSSKDILIQATDEIKLDATKIVLNARQSVDITGTQSVAVKGANVDVKADMALSASGGVSAEVKGQATATLQAAGQAVVKGAMVMIN